MFSVKSIAERRAELRHLAGNGSERDPDRLPLHFTEVVTDFGDAKGRLYARRLSCALSAAAYPERIREWLLNTRLSLLSTLKAV